MDDEDDHLCIVCNQTIHGLLNYVLHRKTMCTDKKKATNESTRPLSNADGTIFGNDTGTCKTSLPTNAGTSLNKSYQENNTLGTSEPVCADQIRLQSNRDRTGLWNQSVEDVYRDTAVFRELATPSIVGGNVNLSRNPTDTLVNHESVQLTPCDNRWYGVSDDIKRIVSDTQQNSQSIPTDEAVCTEKHCVSSGLNQTSASTFFTKNEANNETRKSANAPLKYEYGLLSVDIHTPHMSKDELTLDARGSSSPMKGDEASEPSQDGASVKLGKMSSTNRRKRNSRKSSRRYRISIRSRGKKCNVCDVMLGSFYKFHEHCRSRQHIVRVVACRKSVNSNMNPSVTNTDAKCNTLIDVDSKKETKVGNNLSEDLEQSASGELEAGNPVDDGEHSENRIEELDCSESDDDNNDKVKHDIDELNVSHSDSDNSDITDEGLFSRGYQCTVCDKLFPRRANLVRHLLSKVHKSKVVGNEQEQFAMIEKYHGSIVHHSPYQCDLCSFYFNTNHDFEDHLKSFDHKLKFDHLVGDIECTLCKFKTSVDKNLLEHLKDASHVKKIEQQNKMCILRVVKSQKVDRKQGHKKHVCRVCPAEFSNKSSYALHFLTTEHNRRKLAVDAKNIKFEDTNKNREVDIFGSILAVNEIKQEGFASGPDYVLDWTGSQIDDSESTKNEIDCVLTDEAVEISGNMSCDLGHHSKHAYQNEHYKALQNEQSTNKGFKVESSNESYSLKKTSSCKYCSFEARNYNDLRPHYMKEHLAMVRICEVCDFVFPYGKGYKLHINSKDHQANIAKYGSTTEGLFQCHVCMKRFADEGYCNFHTAYYHFHPTTEDDILRENSNSETRVKYEKFLKSIEDIYKTDIVSCPECNAGVKKNSMIAHLRQHTGERPFKCNICMDDFYNSSTLRRHILGHYSCLDNTCEVCGEHFKSLSSYNSHMQLHKAISTSMEKTNICHECGDSFYIRRQLQNHMKKHDKKSLKCDHPGCLWAFSTPNALKRHKLTHSFENPFICPTCGYTTKSKKYLQSHEKIHEKDKVLLECEHCPYKTAKNTHLRRHMRIHLGVKPYKCPYCSYACNTHDNIRKHILETRVHKGLKVYPCKLCRYATNSTKEFRAHLIIDHVEETNNGTRLDSLAAFTGLFNKEEDITVPIVGMEIIPCKDRKTTRRKFGSDTELQTKVDCYNYSVEPLFIKL